MDLNLGIALPHTKTHFRKEFVKSFFCMAKPMDSVYLEPITTGPLDGVRNELVIQAQSYECTHILFMDTDQMYPPNTINQLINHDLDIVAAKVHRRRPPYDPLLKIRNDDPNVPFIDMADDDWIGQKIVEVDATGFGCVLIKMDVFDAIKKPWFKFDIHKAPVLGEDVYFYIKAKESGFRVFVDLTLDIGHLATASINENIYFAYKHAQASNVG